MFADGLQGLKESESGSGLVVSVGEGRRSVEQGCGEKKVVDRVRGWAAGEKVFKGVCAITRKRRVSGGGQARACDCGVPTLVGLHFKQTPGQPITSIFQIQGRNLNPPCLTAIVFQGRECCMHAQIGPHSARKRKASARLDLGVGGTEIRCGANKKQEK